MPSQRNRARLAQTTGLPRICCQCSCGFLSISTRATAISAMTWETDVEIRIVNPSTNAMTQRNRASLAGLSITAPLGNHEDPPEGEQSLAPLVAPIGLGDQRAVGQFERDALTFLERCEQGTEGGPLGPFGHGVFPLENLKICGFP